MPNRTKTERNKKIYEYYKKGFRYESIAKIFKMKTSAVGMVITRERRKENATD